MSLYKVIKHQAAASSRNEILSTRSNIEFLEDDKKFHTFDSLWQSDDVEHTQAVNKLQEEREKVERETIEMLARARSEVGQIEKDAYDKGFNQGKQEALDAESKKLQQKMAELELVINAIAGDRNTLHVNYENDILTLVKTLVDRVLFHEVTVNPLVIQACLKTAMSYVVGNSSVKVRLHAQDLQRLKDASFENPDFLADFNQVELVEDVTISEGGCLLETGFGEVDASLETRKDRLYAALDAVFIKALEG